MKEQFLPTNTSSIARKALRKLKHNSTIKDHVKNFNSLLLDVRRMSEEDKLFNFMTGLQVLAQTELRRSGVQNISQAIAAIDSLVDYQIQPKGKGKKGTRMHNIGSKNARPSSEKD